MYNVAHFKEPDQQEVVAFMKAHPFVTLIGNQAGRAFVTQVPVVIEEKGGKLILRGHLMRKSDHHIALEQNPEALIVFSGPHAYVSATWYANPHMGSTWNYINVQARGQIRFTDTEELKLIMQQLSLHYEAGNASSSTVFANLPDEYVNSMLKGIVGFELVPDDIQHIFKLSQNRDEESYNRIASKLKEQGGDAAAIAAIMENRKSKVFPQ